jgi:hypothetical protein
MRDLTLQEMDQQLAEQLPARELMGGCCRQKCTYQPAPHRHDGGVTVIASPGNGNGQGNGNGNGNGFASGNQLIGGNGNGNGIANGSTVVIEVGGGGNAV